MTERLRERFELPESSVTVAGDTIELHTQKERKVRQLGELVAATGADGLDAETLAGGLLAMVEASDPARKESWRKRGQAFFQRRPRGTAAGAELGDARGAPDKGGPAPA